MAIVVACIFCYKRRSGEKRDMGSFNELLTTMTGSTRPPSYNEGLIPSSPGTSVVHIEPTSPDLDLLEMGSIYKPPAALPRESIHIDALPPVNYNPVEHEYEND